MIKSSALNNLYRIYAFAVRDNIEFHYVDITASHVSEASEMFDIAEMNRLFETGYEMALSGDAWQNEPPGFRDRAGQPQASLLWSCKGSILRLITR